MLITISLLVLAYMIMSKDISGLLENVEETLNEWFGVEYELIEG